MITLMLKSLELFFFHSASCQRVRLHGVVRCVRACQRRRVVLQKGQRSATPRTDRAKAASPEPSLRPSSLAHVLSWDVSVGDGFPGNQLLSVLWGWCGRFAEGCEGRWEERKVGVQSGIGWWRELREQGKQLSAIIQSASVFSFPSFSLINTGPWLKRRHEPNEPPFAYTCCVKSELTPECEFTLTWSC